ncbi:MAG: pilus assembly protein PilM [Defluviitaleaceae bacterium]|nr:pilus assembly protein PilM [Defluviitaleaceae bacterium]
MKSKKAKNSKTEKTKKRKNKVIKNNSIYNININSNSVNVIKKSKNGEIEKAKTVTFAPMDEIDDDYDDYIDALSSALKRATKDFKLPSSKNSCSVVIGDSKIILDRFSWPDLPEESFATNAELSITPILPEKSQNYVFGFEILSRSKIKDGDERARYNLEVLVAAIPKAYLRAIKAALLEAKFKATNIDLRENVINKFIHVYFDLPEEKPTYGIIFIGEEISNIALYVNGNFYSNHYFTKSQDETQTPEQSFLNLMEEIKSITEYVKYKEEKEVSFILTKYTSKTKNITQRLSENLEIPVKDFIDFEKDFAELDFEPYINQYLEAYSASLPPFLQEFNPLNFAAVNLERTKKKPQKTSGALKIVISFAWMGFIAFTAYMFLRERGLINEVNRLQTEMDMFPVTEMQHNILTAEVNTIQNKILLVQEFFELEPNAYQVLSLLHSLEPLFSLSIENITRHDAWDFDMIVSIEAPDLNTAAELINYLRGQEIVQDATLRQITAETNYERNVPDLKYSTTQTRRELANSRFELTITLMPGLEDIEA